MPSLELLCEPRCLAPSFSTKNDIVLELELRQLLQSEGLDPKIYIRKRKNLIMVESAPEHFELIYSTVIRKHPEFELSSYNDSDQVISMVTKKIICAC